MKKLFPFVIAAAFLSMCASQAFSQTSATTNITIEKKHKVFVRADFAGVNFSSYSSYSRSYNGGSYSGENAALTLGYCVSKKVRLGVGSEIITDNDSKAALPGKVPVISVPVYVSFEYGNHNKNVSPFIDLNAGYSFVVNQFTSYYEGTFNMTNGTFFELLPGVSLGSKKSGIRYRAALGGQLQFSEIQYAPPPYSEADASSANLVIARIVLKVGVDF